MERGGVGKKKKKNIIPAELQVHHPSRRVKEGKKRKPQSRDSAAPGSSLHGEFSPGMCAGANAEMDEKIKKKRKIPKDLTRTLFLPFL